MKGSLFKKNPCSGFKILSNDGKLVSQINATGDVVDLSVQKPKVFQSIQKVKMEDSKITLQITFLPDVTEKKFYYQFLCAGDDIISYAVSI